VVEAEAELNFVCFVGCCMYVGCGFVPRLRSVFWLPQLDAQSREWLVVSSQANYQMLAKLAADNPRLARFKVGTFLPH